MSSVAPSRRVFVILASSTADHLNSNSNHVGLQPIQPLAIYEDVADRVRRRSRSNKGSINGSRINMDAAQSRPCRPRLQIAESSIVQSPEHDVGGDDVLTYFS